MSWVQRERHYYIQGEGINQDRSTATMEITDETIHPAYYRCRIRSYLVGHIVHETRQPGIWSVPRLYGLFQKAIRQHCRGGLSHGGEM